MRKPVMAVAAIALAAAVVAAGCGGGSSSGGAYGESSNAAETSASSGRSYGRAYPSSSSAGQSSGGGSGGTAVVAVASVPGVGRVLVDSEGFTLYEFGKDSGTKSTCYGTCATDWPPLLTSGAPKPGSGASMSKLGTSKRSDGTVQVTYAGRPLYTFFEDTKAGEAKGNGVSFFGGRWYALTAQGTAAGG